MAGGIFVSYRRDDSRQAAGRLADDLAEHFGNANIFRDIEGIELGVDFEEALNRALEICVVMLVLIGPRWLDIRDAKGERRLDDPRDWIRQEIETALQRDIRVVPVLVDGTPLPDEQALPPELRPLVRRQALDIADARWRGDLQRLVETLAKVPGLSLKTPPKAPPAVALPPPAPTTGAGKKWLKTGIYSLVALGVIGYVAEEFDSSNGSSGGMNVIPPAPDPVFNPAPAPNPAPLVKPSAAPPNLAGLWRTPDGETYQISQQGNQISLIAHAAGQQVGNGQGQLDGRLLRVSISMVIGGVPLGTANCNLQATPDFSHFGGVCQSPNGQFQAQMFR